VILSLCIEEEFKELVYLMQIWQLCWLFRKVEDSVAPLIRWCGWYSYLHICRLFLNLTVKTALNPWIF